MKKLFSIIITITLLLFLVSCKEKDIDFEIDGGGFYYSEFSSMDTIIKIRVDQKDKNTGNIKEAFPKIRELFDDYNNLTDNYRGYEGYNNAFYINNNPNKKIEIDYRLYDILLLSEELRVLTKGYFDVSIGNIIDVWKGALENDRVSQEELDEYMAQALSIPVIEDGINLEKVDNKYYVTIKEGVKIDLGAIAKGYAVEKANDIMKEYNFTYYQVLGSESSLHYGKNTNPKRGYYTVGLSGPLDYVNENPDYGRFYEIIMAEDISVTTSGDAQQNLKVGDYLIHHIVSPVTKIPENDRRMMTIIHEDAAIADALSTALFSMPSDILEDWVNENDNIRIIFLNSDETIERYNVDSYLFKP